MLPPPSLPMMSMTRKGRRSPSSGPRPLPCWNGPGTGWRRSTWRWPGLTTAAMARASAAASRSPRRGWPPARRPGPASAARVPGRSAPGRPVDGRRHGAADRGRSAGWPGRVSRRHRFADLLPGIAGGGHSAAGRQRDQRRGVRGLLAGLGGGFPDGTTRAGPVALALGAAGRAGRGGRRRVAAGYPGRGLRPGGAVPGGVRGAGLAAPASDLWLAGATSRARQQALAASRAARGVGLQRLLGGRGRSDDPRRAHAHR